MHLRTNCLLVVLFLLLAGCQTTNVYNSVHFNNVQPAPPARAQALTPIPPIASAPVSSVPPIAQSGPNGWIVWIVGAVFAVIGLIFKAEAVWDRRRQRATLLRIKTPVS